MKWQLVISHCPNQAPVTRRFAQSTGMGLVCLGNLNTSALPDVIRRKFVRRCEHFASSLRRLVLGWNRGPANRRSDWHRSWTGHQRILLRSPVREGNLPLLQKSKPIHGYTRHPIQNVPAAVFPGLMRPGREATHSSPSSGNIENVWSYVSTPRMPSLRWTLRS